MSFCAYNIKYEAVANSPQSGPGGGCGNSFQMSLSNLTTFLNLYFYNIKCGPRLDSCTLHTMTCTYYIYTLLLSYLSSFYVDKEYENQMFRFNFLIFEYIIIQTFHLE